MLLAPVRFGLPLLAPVAAGLALPFALQAPEYVTEQYRYWFENLARDDRTAMPLYAGYQDVHMLVRVAGLRVPRGAYQFVQAGVGLLAAGALVWLRLRGAARTDLVTAALVLGCAG